MCVQCTRFIQVLTRTDRSTIVLQCSLRAPTLTPKYIPRGISFFASSRHPGSLHRTGVFDRYQPTRSSAYPIGPNRFGPRLLQPIRPMLSLYLNTCQNNILARGMRQRDLYASTRRFCVERKGESGVSTEEKIVWSEASPTPMVQEF